MFGPWSNIWVRVRSGLPGRVAGGAGGVHPCIMAPMESSPIMCGNLWCSTAAQVWGRVGGWEADGRVWVHSRLPGRVVRHPDVMAPMESSPIMCGNLWCSIAAQVWGRVGGWEAEGRVWVHSGLPGRAAGHLDVMASHGGSPIITATTTVGANPGSHPPGAATTTTVGASPGFPPSATPTPLVPWRGGGGGEGGGQWATPKTTSVGPVLVPLPLLLPPTTTPRAFENARGGWRGGQWATPKTTSVGPGPVPLPLPLPPTATPRASENAWGGWRGG